MNNPTVSHVRKNTMRTKISILLVLVLISSLIGCAPAAPADPGSACPETVRTYDERAGALGCEDAWQGCPTSTLNGVSCVSQIHSAASCADLSRVATFCAQ